MLHIANTGPWMINMRQGTCAERDAHGIFWSRLVDFTLFLMCISYSISYPCCENGIRPDVCVQPAVSHSACALVKWYMVRSLGEASCIARGRRPRAIQLAEIIWPYTTCTIKIIYQFITSSPFQLQKVHYGIDSPPKPHIYIATRTGGVSNL